MKADLEKLLTTGLIQGKNPRQLAAELKKKFNTTTFNAERLMRTELARVQTEAQKQSFERNGFEEYEFIANSNCCDICKENDGKHFKVSKMMPGENAAPMHPHCRCSTAAYSDRKEYDEWLDFLEKGGTTEEYNKLKKMKVNDSVTISGAKSGTLKVDIQHFAINPADLETVILPKEEYAHVTSEINTNITEEQLKRKVVSKPIGDYIYTFECFGFDDYRIINKEKIEGVD